MTNFEIVKFYNHKKRKIMSKKVAILATNGFEESELKSPKEHLEEQGWTAHIISPESGSIKAWKGKDWGGTYTVDKKLSEAEGKKNIKLQWQSNQR